MNYLTNISEGVMIRNNAVSFLAGDSMSARVAYPDSIGLAFRTLSTAERNKEMSLQRRRVKVFTDAKLLLEDEITLNSLCSHFTEKRWLFLSKASMYGDSDPKILHTVH